MKNPYTMAHQLLMSGDVEEAKRLINKDPNLAKEKDDSGRLPIHWAASMGFKEVCEYLLVLSLGEDIDVHDDTDMTPLIIAAAAGKIQVVNLFVDNGADINSRNKNGHSALQYAASKNHYEIVEILLSNNANVNICDEMNATPLHRAASQGLSKIVQLLVTQGKRIDLNARDNSGNTALHLACEEDRIDEARFLIRHGASVDIENKDKKVPFDLASDRTRQSLTAFASSL